MNGKLRMFILSAIMFGFQYVMIVFGYRQLVGYSVYQRVFIILIVNWFVIIGVTYISLNRLFKLKDSFQGLYNKYSMNSILYDLLQSLAKVEDSKKANDLILEAAINSIPKAKFGSILMGDYGKLRYVAAKGFDLEYLEIIELGVHETALYKLTDGLMDRPVIIEDILRLERSTLDEAKVDLFAKADINKIRSSISAPIVIDEALSGCVNLDSDIVNVFTEDDLESLELFALEIGKFVQLHRTLDLNRTMSRYDDLTKIYNRGYCTFLIKELMSKDNPFVMISIDMNNLKSVNDLYGHDVGDQLIKSFVNTMKLFLGDDVIFARYGGDEFLLVFPNNSYVEAVVVVDDAAIFMANNVVKDCDYPICVTYCYGVVEYPKESKDYDEILKIADNRMYRQKRKFKENVKRV